MLDAALDLAARGWPVFPCKAAGKEPLTDHGFKDATTDETVIRAWWSATPTANVAIATGAPGPDVLDVDIKPAGTGWPAFDQLRRAGRLAGAIRLVTTRNGGAHVYFAGTGQPCGAIRKAHIDFKAAGGYVLAPPSMVPADEYAPQGTGRYEIVWSRESDSRLDWASCRALLTPAPRLRAPSRIPAVDLDHLPRWLCDRLADADPTDRSAAFHGLVAGCAYAGLDLAQTTAVLASWPPGVAKYGHRLTSEVERSWAKVRGAA